MAKSVGGRPNKRYKAGRNDLLPDLKIVQVPIEKIKKAQRLVRKPSCLAPSFSTIDLRFL